MTAMLVEAVKELKAQNDALKAIVCEDHPEKAKRMEQLIYLDTHAALWLYKDTLIRDHYPQAFLQ
jgi:3-deoxy-D-manno-octulosonic-acid transferase